MSEESPQTTRYDTEPDNASAYEMMNKKIKDFIKLVDEEERRRNVILHTRLDNDD
ncbi:MAG: hypothetical protein SOZ80_03900 [Prevotella sp.]|uniref:hypothetical protein n=1 Tax=Prevotella sp. TaxID=59823 RepID=UPI002A344805|nr:hypothetical protein [Prevotella sp.]MDD7317300.1 hypothetical protein [Prevotellaceae bacterium]MDY4019904.1 hypothetical protein [Prevotella sp.]